MENKTENKKLLYNKKGRLTIGFSGIADFRSIIGQEIFAGVVKACEDFDVNLINFVGAVKYSVAEDIEFIEQFKKKFKFMNFHNIDGLVTWASSFQGYMPEKEIIEIHNNFSSLPMTCIGVPMLKNIPGVYNKNYYGVKVIMDHLIKHHNYKKIGFIGCKGRIQYEERFNIFKQMLVENNIKVNEDLIFILNTLDKKSVKQAVDNINQKQKLFDKKEVEVFVTVSDIVASSMIDELENIGIKVPSDVAVVGFNNQLDSIKCSTPITTVDLDFFQNGYKAVELLLSIINNKTEHSLKKIEDIVIPSKLVIRQSCGCFEDSIENAEIKKDKLNIKNTKTINFESLIKDNYQDILLEINSALNRIEEKYNADNARAILDSLISDLTDVSSNKFLRLMKNNFSHNKNSGIEKQILWQNVITQIRSTILPYLVLNKEILMKAENIFHQSRIMIDVVNNYSIFSKKADVYKLNALARVAVDFASTVDMKGIIDLIKLHMDELEIPGIYLVLYNELRTDLGEGTLVLTYQKNEETITDNNFTNIGFDRIVPKRLLPKSKRYSFMFEICYYKNSYIGYLLVEMGPINIPLYETVRSILSSSLYASILSQEKFESVKENQLLLRNSKFKKIFENEKNVNVDNNSKSLNAHKILEYLILHINDVTNLDVFAGDLNISKSSLTRKTKNLTGYSIQKLHEMLKMERAKLLLENKLLNISEISDRLGYQNQFYFSRVFKKHTGISPKKWMDRKVK
jgi:DNA-binding LacI/PurR family transcriptional regulator/AraC-like DNA-binding protein